MSYIICVRVKMSRTVQICKETMIAVVYIAKNCGGARVFHCQIRACIEFSKHTTAETIQRLAQITFAAMTRHFVCEGSVLCPVVQFVRKGILSHFFIILIVHCVKFVCFFFLQLRFRPCVRKEKNTKWFRFLGHQKYGLVWMFRFC